MFECRHALLHLKIRDKPCLVWVRADGEQFSVCPLEGRYGLMHNEVWSCHDKKWRKKNPWSKDLWRTFELVSPLCCKT